MLKTKIDWCDSTLNIITGCLHDCPYCYARCISNRFKSRKSCKLVEPSTYRIVTDEGKELFEINEAAFFRDKDTGFRYQCAYPYGFKPTLHRYRMEEYKTKTKSRNIFVGSMADVFGEWVPERWIAEVFSACKAAPQHNYLFLTKNPGRYIDLAEHDGLPKGDNFWYGSTITKKDDPFAWFERESGYHYFLSIEPILDELGIFGTNGLNLPEWVIIGAETGNRKDKVIPRREWIESIVNQCRQYKIPVFMKSSLTDIWGEELIQEFPKELIHG